MKHTKPNTPKQPRLDSERAIRQPLDYAPYLNSHEFKKTQRHKKMHAFCAWAIITFLFSAFVFFTLAGVYLVRVDGLADGWLPLGIGLGAGSTLLGLYLSCGVVRAMFRGEQI